MIERLKMGGAFIGGLALLLIPLVLAVVFFRGAAWLAENTLEWVFAVGWLVLAIDILIALPLAVFRRFRKFSGTVVFASSYIFGTATWLLGFALTYSLWGLGAVVIGLLFFGIGVVAMAILATMLKGMWSVTATLLVMLGLTFGGRLAGAALLASGEESATLAEA